MKHPLEKLKPKSVFDYFFQITQIPRPSRHEEGARQFVQAFADAIGLRHAQDDIGNVVIYKPASRGYERCPSVLLQGHLDMVCEKDPDAKIDFLKDPIRPRVVGEWVRASGTTLGADNGIALAAMLAILADPKAVHGPLECLFTVDEETGLNGAKHVDANLIKSRMMLNLDSEDEGVIFIGCAGGRDATLQLPVKWKVPDPTRVALRIVVGGATGGHSGMDIHLGRANAIQCLTRVLRKLNQSPGTRIAMVRGGNLRNAIPRDAEATIIVQPEDIALAKQVITESAADILPLYIGTDPKLSIHFEEVALPARTLKRSQTDTLIHLMHALPHGVQAMSRDIPDVVETSVNFATVETRDGAIVLGLSHRSSIEAEKRNLLERTRAVADLAGCTVEESDGYPGWKPDVKSKLLDLARSVFEKTYKKSPTVTAIHAGLECGLLKEKFPDMDVISIGPTIRGAHSPEERLHIPSVEPFTRAVLEILKGVRDWKSRVPKDAKKKKRK